jgi:hypothetical protein
MEMRDSKITTGRPVGPQIIGHQLVWHTIQLLQQFPHQFQCRPLVPLALHQNVEDLALGVDRTPQVDQPTIDFDENLVKMPSGMRPGPAPSKVNCDHGTEVIHPATHRLIGNDDPTLGQQVLDIAKAQGEPGIKPDGPLDDHWREAIPAVADLGHRERLRPQITADKPTNVTKPYHRPVTPFALSKFLLIAFCEAGAFTGSFGVCDGAGTGRGTAGFGIASGISIGCEPG